MLEPLVAHAPELVERVSWIPYEPGQGAVAVRADGVGAPDYDVYQTSSTEEARALLSLLARVREEWTYSIARATTRRSFEQGVADIINSTDLAREVQVLSTGETMTQAEFEAARRVLDLTDVDIAVEFNVTPAVVRGWSSGQLPIPRRCAQKLRWLSEMEQRRTALAASGLPVCEWMHAHMEDIPLNPDVLQPHLDSAERHLTNCHACRAREQFEMERFGPMPPYPQPGWMQPFQLLDKVPAWGRPALLGAVILVLMVGLRTLLFFPSALGSLQQLGEVLVVMAAAAIAGASGGLVYTLTHPTLRKLGRSGAYLTGIVCVLTYMMALAAIAPFAFNEAIIENRSDAVIFGMLSVFFGLFVGHSWFREPEAA